MVAGVGIWLPDHLGPAYWSSTAHPHPLLWCEHCQVNKNGDTWSWLVTAWPPSSPLSGEKAWGWGTPPASCCRTGLSTQTVYRAGQPPRTLARLEHRGGGSRHLPWEWPGLRVQSGWPRAKPVAGQEGSAPHTALWEAVSHPPVVSPDGLHGGGDGEQRALCMP